MQLQLKSMISFSYKEDAKSFSKRRVLYKTRFKKYLLLNSDLLKR